MGGRGVKNRSFRKYLKLNDYQFKTNRYRYRSTCMNSIIIINQKLTIDTQNLKRNEHKDTIKENHQTTREETKNEKNREEL